MSLTLHEFARSGNAYKIRLLLAHLGRPYARREYNILNGETRTPAFLANVNANGRIPVLQDGDRFLPESNAALFYLAEGTPYLSADAFDKADTLRWLFWEQYNHEPNIATLRYWATYGGGLDAQPEAKRAQLAGKQAGGEEALALMDAHLGTHEWLAGGAFSIADIALHAYTHVADEGGFTLARYPQVQAWLARVAALPGHLGIDA